MAEEGVVDHQSAKAKAIERLGLPDNSARPDNREIESALSEYLQLFEAVELVERRKRWRETAIEAMRLLHDFNTYRNRFQSCCMTTRFRTTRGSAAYAARPKITSTSRRFALLLTKSTSRYFALKAKRLAAPC